MTKQAEAQARIVAAALLRVYALPPLTKSKQIVMEERRQKPREQGIVWQR